MTHVLDEAIDDLEGQLREDWRRRVRSLPRCRAHSRMIRSTAAALRILRAERDGTRSAAEEALSEAAEVLGCDTGHVADTARLTLDDYSRLGSRVAAMLDNARAEGRREAAEGDWWCSECEEALPPSRVTHQERCDTCGSAVAWKEAHEPTPDELRAEGRREEREQLIPWMRERLRGMIVETCEDLEPALQEAERGDHWRGGEG